MEKCTKFYKCSSYWLAAITVNGWVQPTPHKNIPTIVVFNAFMHLCHKDYSVLYAPCIRSKYFSMLPGWIIFTPHYVLILVPVKSYSMCMTRFVHLYQRLSHCIVIEISTNNFPSHHVTSYLINESDKVWSLWQKSTRSCSCFNRYSEVMLFKVSRK